MEYKWGLGLEHEFHLFFVKNKEYHKIKYVCDAHKIAEKLINSKKISDEDKTFLQNIVWEYSGRQCKTKNNRQFIIQKRIPTLMAEMITKNHINRSIQSIATEIRAKEKKFIEILKKSSKLQRYIEKYGDLSISPYGMIRDVKMINDSTKYTDYTGSYHVTITLPHKKSIKQQTFIDLHKNFANQIQWIQPLLLSVFFSPDQLSIINDKTSQGSFRVFQVGWGMFSSSDVSKISKTTGISRMSNQSMKWISLLNFENKNKFDKCDLNFIKTKEPNAKSLYGSDFRTFGPIIQKFDKIERENASGMKVPYGLELRIFDNFNSCNINSLMKIIVLIAENSRKFKTPDYVYDNKIWQSTIINISKNGWNGIISTQYIHLLEKMLNINLSNKYKRADLVFQDLVNKLVDKNKNGLFVKLMSNKFNSVTIPNINREAMKVSFQKFLESDVDKIITKSKYTKKEFEKLLESRFNKTVSNNINDVLYALKDLDKVELEIKNKKIINIFIKNKLLSNDLKFINFII